MSEILTFVSKDNAETICVISDYICAFQPKDNGYEVFLKQGGSLFIKSGIYEYEQLKRALENNLSK